MSNIQCRTLQQHHVPVPRGFAREFDGVLAALTGLFRTLFEALLTWQRRARERRHLAELDPRLLRDMGISEAEAARESAIPFWRLK